MQRRSFLMGLGKFAGAALALPVVPTIFDMGRSTGLWKQSITRLGWEGPNGEFVPDLWLDGIGYRLRSPAVRRYTHDVDVTFDVDLSAYDWGSYYPAVIKNVDPASIYPEWRHGKLAEVHQLSLTPRLPSSGNAGTSAL